MRSPALPLPCTIDPDDPRAPSQEVWEHLTEEERLAVLDALPSEFPASEASPPEGDVHFDAKSSIRDTLRRYFRGRNRRVYVASELAVYYPDEPMFAPDIMAVCDVDLHPRDHWVVSREGKGIDFALEIHSRGSLVKDLNRNVEKLARLGVAEYFVWDIRRDVLYGFRLAPEGGGFVPMRISAGKMPSDVLGLDLALKDGTLRFFREGAPVPVVDELVEWLQSTTDELAAKHIAESQRANEADERADAEAKRAEAEAERADAAERRLAEALAELAKLRGH